MNCFFFLWSAEISFFIVCPSHIAYLFSYVYLQVAVNADKIGLTFQFSPDLADDAEYDNIRAICIENNIKW